MLHVCALQAAIVVELARYAYCDSSALRSHSHTILNGCIHVFLFFFYSAFLLLLLFLLESSFAAHHTDGVSCSHTTFAELA